jgi:Tfp pilus assembly protein PilN
MRAVNLLPREEQRKRLEGTRTPLLVAAGGIAAATTAAVVLGLSASGAADERRTELQSIEAAIARLPRAPEPAVSQGVLSQERADRVAALSAALSSRIPFDRVLRQISLVLPDDAWLTGIKAASAASVTPAAGSSTEPTPAPQASTGAQGVTIEGATYSHASVVNVLSRLSVIPTLAEPRLTGSAVVVQEAPQSQTAGGERAAPAKPGKRIVTFTITASLRTEGSS